MNRFVKFLGILPLLLTGCSAEDAVSTDITPSDDVVSDITVSISDFKGTTRTLIDPNDNYSMKWTEDDRIVILPQNGQSIGFPLNSETESNTATFTGSGWLLRSDVPYIAFYNQRFNDAVYDHDNVTLEYQNLKWDNFPWQYSNNSLNQVRYYDYLLSDYTDAHNGSLTFQLNHIGCLVHVTAYDMPAYEYDHLNISTEDGTEIFYNRVRLNLIEGTTSPYVFESENDAERDEDNNGPRMSNFVRLNLGNFQPNSGKLDLYLMVYPTDATGHDLTVNIDNFIFTVPGRNFEKGTYQHIEVFNELPGTEAPGLTHRDWNEY